ncbi:MAG: PIN domain-containing protein [Gemmatimonadetes bacterium]|nr:PIN domain-containing protein [Gemmatimonadota bacterium]
MRHLFVDTSAWVAMADASDPDHAACATARDAWLEGAGVLVTTDYVVDETLTLLRMRLGVDAAQDWWTQVENSSRIRWEWISPARSDKARAWLFRWRDKDFSFTDCTSFVVMRELRVRVALTVGRHFRQAGFDELP